MINVYPLSQTLKILQSRIEENEGEITPDIEQAFNEACLERDEKLEALALLIKNTNAEIGAIAAEVKRLRDLKFQVERKADRLEKMVASILMTGESWANGPHKFWWHPSRAVELEEGVTLPEVYYRTKIISEVDKEKITADIKGGAVIPGAILAERYTLKLK